MTEREKVVHADLVKARAVGKTVEFIATFGAILGIQILFGTFLISLVAGIVAYAIVNGVLEFNLKSIKSKLGL
ncbi:MAG TPA: hypothetical protein VFM69_01135 [Pricia sp.]|nr:hypothetical protein [Pricia sp.]